MTAAPRRSSRPERIISGGQTGVDRAALDAALALGISHGGWCPRGRRAEDGRIADRYQLQETDSPDYPERTERNVADSDATLILCRGTLAGGTLLTQRMAQRRRKPCLIVDLDSPAPVAEIQQWIAQEKIRLLNVAGPRESQQPGIAAAAEAFLIVLLS